MITAEDLRAANAVLDEMENAVAPPPVSASVPPTAIVESKIFAAAAAQSAELAAAFIGQGNRRAGREHLWRALEQLNAAERCVR